MSTARYITPSLKLREETRNKQRSRKTYPRLREKIVFKKIIDSTRTIQEQLPRQPTANEDFLLLLLSRQDEVYSALLLPHTGVINEHNRQNSESEGQEVVYILYRATVYHRARKQTHTDTLCTMWKHCLWIHPLSISLYSVFRVEGGLEPIPLDLGHEAGRGANPLQTHTNAHLHTIGNLGFN